MKREDIQIKFVDIDLLEYNNGQIPGVPENPRTREDKKQRDLQKSIEELPEMTIARAALCFMHDGHYVVIGGNRRLEAQRALQRKEVPIIELPKDTPVEKLRRIALLDNESTGETDWAKVAKEWNADEIKAWNISTPKGWHNEQKRKEVQDDEFEENTDQIEHRVTLGDIWQLGNHRLMCGDSTDSDTVTKLMSGEMADMTFSDAPYNVDFKGSMSNTTKNGVAIKHKGANTRHESIRNDKMNKDDFFNFMMKILENIKANVTGAWYLSFSSVNLEELLNPLRTSGMDWKSIIIWMKNEATLSMKDYKSRYEPIVYGRFNDAWYGNRGFEEDIWEYQRTLKNDLHPTMKPVPLIGKMVQDGSKEDGIVLDLFGGSGSTMIACEQLGRKCRMMELDPHYCDVIISRWEKLTGGQARKIR